MPISVGNQASIAIISVLC